MEAENIMTRPLVTVGEFASSESCKSCGKPALFIVTPIPDVRHELCGNCTAAYVLKFVEKHGFQLEDHRESFLKLSAALNALLAASSASSLVQ